MNKSWWRYSLTAAFVLGALSSSSMLWAKENVATNHSVSLSQQGFETLAVKINTSPTDQATYQAIRLDNGMEVLLISDDKANKSLFSVGLPIGSMEDPIKQQGLAHYLEHMILMGSKNYPETNSLDGFLTKNGGRNNAYTAPDRTIYYLQVNNNAFDEAVARLSDAFAEPLLLESNAKKELNAVNAEMVRAKSNDGHLIRSVNRATANPSHPFTGFAVGNLETLNDKENSVLQQELEAFYSRYYSANLMKAVLYSNKPISELATLAAKTLGKVKNNNVSIPKIEMPLFLPEHLGVVLHYKPVLPTKNLTISFDMPEDRAAFKHKSGEYLSYVFSNNTEGTLSDYLIKNGLSDSGVAAIYNDDISRNRGSFSIYIRLTDKGLAEKDHIISLVFQQIEKIQQSGIQASYFSELKESLSQDFNHLRIDKNFSYAADLVSQMLSYPLENIFDQSYVAQEMDEAAIKAKLALMTLDNARIFIIDENVQTDQKTPYFEAPYTINKITPEQRNKWLDFSQNPALQLPQLNPYFASDFSINALDKTRIVPKLILQEKGREIYAMPSRYFSHEAKARLRISMAISPRVDEVKNEVASALLNIMNNLTQSKTTFQASVAGIEASLNIRSNGVVIQAEGYTQHLAKLLQNMLIDFVSFELTEKNLEQAKVRYLESLKAEEKASAQQQAMQSTADFAQYPFYDRSNRQQIAQSITLAELEKQRTRLIHEITGIRVLSVGNLSDTQLQSLVDELEKSVKNQNSAIETGRYADINQSQRKMNLIKSIPHEDNALSVSYFAHNAGELESNVRSNLLGNILSRWYFDDLRTDKQLGYVVSAGRDRIGITSGIVFVVQSPTASPKSIMEHNQRFIQESFTRLQSMSAADFEKYRSNLIEILQHKPESLESEFNEYSGDFLRGNHKFDRKEKIIHLLQQLTLQDLIHFYQDLLIEQQGLVFVTQAIGTNSQINQPAELEGFEQIESIEQLQKTFKIKHYE